MVVCEAGAVSSLPYRSPWFNLTCTSLTGLTQPQAVAVVSLTNFSYLAVSTSSSVSIFRCVSPEPMFVLSRWVSVWWGHTSQRQG